MAVGGSKLRGLYVWPLLSGDPLLLLRRWVGCLNSEECRHCYFILRVNPLSLLPVHLTCLPDAGRFLRQVPILLAKGDASRETRPIIPSEPPCSDRRLGKLGMFRRRRLRFGVLPAHVTWPASLISGLGGFGVVWILDCGFDGAVYQHRVGRSVG